ncbi:hypothetical protein O2W15_03985 [Modestobacter sp. VKM Ac-2979]|uniref:hypothetical protein n=1 Tax=unclassified Modestobacter TaxID=2643866 RepID=UPI0022AB5772|nr:MULTISPECIES: hypothetical protein [unclassified Modestobacter]MCZ2810586.1 hypothetical protein [Modestobacter sp. VKM Ac-2979]MCZ2842072.1 hypothetical protein [Modestobacter sp. VKM Ac-2980]
MPSGGSVSAQAGASLLQLGGTVALLVVGVTVLVLLLRWATGQLQADRAARRRARALPESAARPAARLPAAAPPRRRATGSHPAGRRVPRNTLASGPTERPHRPLERVAADLRRLARELAMVPGGMPMERRRGLLAAYDDLLVEAAVLLEVPQQLTEVPEEAREFERIRLLGALEAAGLVVTG